MVKLDKIKDKKDYAILNEINNILSKLGVEILDSTTYLKDLIPSRGTLTKREPSQKEWDDINYGKDVAKKLSGFDIGQTIVVKEKALILAKEIGPTESSRQSLAPPPEVCGTGSPCEKRDHPAFPKKERARQ